jgi:[protein-PII] uridylyltransferase
VSGEGPVVRLVRSLRALNRAYSSGHHGRWSARRRSDLVDQAVGELARSLPDGVAVVALGGYGRRLLLPGSDVDLMVLHSERRSEPVREPAERMFYPLWDAGISLGHAVRTVEECLVEARSRIDVACSLLDARAVAGDRALPPELARRLLEELRTEGAAFLDRLRADAGGRHERFAPVSMALEPDLKEGSGGLRDVHAIRWARRVAADGSPGSREAAVLDAAEEFLVRVRSALHLLAGRRVDRLALDYQASVAAAFGFEATAGLEATDALMRAVFEHAREVEHVRDGVLPLGGEEIDGGIPASPDELLETFGTAASRSARLSSAALDALASSDLGPTPYAWSERARRGFVGILSEGPAGTAALEAMDRVGVLARFLPEWEPVRCRPQRNPYHRFTVDTHLLQTAAHAARALAGGTGRDPVLRTAASAVEDRDAVLLGALLHDIGKVGDGNHAVVGERVAASVLDRMGIEGRSREDVLFLVRHHLLLSETAVRRDLADQDLVLDVAAAVGDPRRLAMLYVLTAADAEATGPHATSPWRMALVRELVGKVQHVLEAGAMDRDRAAALADRVETIGRLLAREDPAAVRAFTARLPRPYLLAVEPEVAAGHFRLLASPIGATEVRTRAEPGQRPGTHEVAVVAEDRPGLLAKIAGSLSLAGLNILSAQAFTTEDGVAIDLFTVEPAFLGHVDEERWRRFRHTLRRALEGREWLEARVREKRAHYPPPAADVSTEVRVLEDASDFFSVVEVETADRIGLLHELAHAFEDLGIDVHLAKVATYGSRVVDAFYVRDLEGRKLGDAGRAEEVERVLTDRVTAG